MQPTKNEVKKPLNAPKAGKSKGPVQNLEHHLHPEWWKRIFNSMYLKTDGDVVEDSKITESEVDFFSQLINIQDNNSLLDVACGQGRHVIELARRGNYRLSGLDRSRYLIQRAKNISKKNGLTINFKEGDARKLPYPTDSFDFVTILGNSFGYFESSEDDFKILKEIFRILKPQGKLLMDVADGNYLKDNFTPRTWEWIDNKHFVCRERSLASDNERLISREVITHSDKGVIVDQFYAERLYTREGLLNLLSKVGFNATQFHGNISSDSARNQDLGMMETRFILTTVADKQWSPTKQKTEIKNIAVLLGDPTLRDSVKPDGMFDCDDFETINKLKGALGKLDNYKFSFLDNHQNLISDLLKLKGKTDLVFNLCDEGYNNEAVKELHIPAILEMMNFPYTGSNPQTLAHCYDKSLVRGIAVEIGVPVADAFVITEDSNFYELNIPFPVIAKPNVGDASFGITQNSVAHNPEQLADAILKLRNQFGSEQPILVEEFLSGSDLTVGIIGNKHNYNVLPIIEEDYSDLPEGLPRICGYEAKWLFDSEYMKTLKSVKANLPQNTEQEIINFSIKLMERLNCRDYCRFDWRLNAQGEPKLLEVNPNPGWCWDGHLAKMANLAGMDYAQMLQSIICAAEARFSVNSNV